MRTLRGKYRAAWYLWGALGLGIEGSALAFYRGRGVTLSEQAWSFEKLGGWAWWAMVGLLVWLTVHLLKLKGIDVTKPITNAVAGV